MDILVGAILSYLFLWPIVQIMCKFEPFIWLSKQLYYKPWLRAIIIPVGLAIMIGLVAIFGREVYIRSTFLTNSLSMFVIIAPFAFGHWMERNYKKNHINKSVSN